MDVRHLTFDAIDKLKRAAGVEAVFDVVKQTAANFGFTNFLVTGVPIRGETLAQHVILSGWPADWMDRYNGRDYVHSDPVAKRIPRTTRPFRWSDLHYDASIDPVGVRIMNEATEFGMKQGFTVPIHGATAYQSCVTFGGDQIQLSDEDASALQIVSLMAHLEARSRKKRGLRSLEDDDDEVEDYGLTPKETEVLRWTSLGKTNDEIATILGNSVRTIDTHLSTLIKKLDVSNRTHAAAQGIRLGLIH
jgi:LuxR family transcriptional regulator, quorum-sensing system regulator BjaR1